MAILSLADIVLKYGPLVGHLLVAIVVAIVVASGGVQKNPENRTVPWLFRT